MQHRLSRGDNLPDFDIDGRDDGVRIGKQRGVARLVLRLRKARARGDGPFLGGLQQCLQTVIVRLTDETFLAQIAEAFEIQRGEFAIRLGAVEIGLRGLYIQIQVARIQSRQHLPGLHVRADIDRAADQFAADAKAERGFITRFDLAGENSTAV